MTTTQATTEKLTVTTALPLNLNVTPTLVFNPCANCQSLIQALTLALTSTLTLPC